VVSSRSARRLTLGVPAVACIAAVIRGGELSTGALVAVGVTGVVVAGVGVVRHAGEAAPRVGRRGLPWAMWLAVAMVWELVALAHDALPTASDLLDPVLAQPAARGVATAGWLAAGAWLVTRPRRPPGKL
jgi:hypothetical protein